MVMQKYQLEVLAPAGDFERLQTAILYGADAVYLAGKEFGMRAASANFDREELKQAVDYAHKHGVKVHVTCNTLPRNNEVGRMPEYLAFLDEMGVDALIIADLGVLEMAKEYAPHTAKHVSVQFGVTNYAAATTLYNLGASRVVLARELSVEEIREIRKKTPPQLELECFVHGAMCMSVSGRCLISNYMIDRDANRGQCAQPCRWKYYLCEEKRPGQFFPIYEDDKGSYILNAKDMCMIEHIDDLAKAGVCSFKIEGRAKSNYYVAAITNAYRCAVDILQQSEEYHCPQWLVDEVGKISHRQYSTGFYYDTPGQYGENGGYVREYEFVGEALSCSDNRVLVLVRSKFDVGDTLDIMRPGKQPLLLKVEHIWSEEGEQLVTANHPMQKVQIDCLQQIPRGSMLRKKTKKEDA